MRLQGKGLLLGLWSPLAHPYEVKGVALGPACPSRSNLHLGPFDAEADLFPFVSALSLSTSLSAHLATAGWKTSHFRSCAI